MADSKIIKNNLIQGSIAWYPFEKGKRALLIVGIKSEFKALAEHLERIGLEVDVVDCLSKSLDSIQGLYDYVVSALGLESMKDLSEAILKVKSILALSGKLLILSDNRLSIKYFVGDKDIFSGNVFDAIEDYGQINLDKISGRGYSKAEIEKSLKDAGFSCKVYGVYPSIFNANMFIKDGYKPNEQLKDRIEPYYENPATVFADEKSLYQTLQDNDLLVAMANGFFVECSFGGELIEYNQITVQGNRDESSAFVTYLTDNEVIKRPMWDGANPLLNIKENGDYLANHGVPMAEDYIDGESYVTKFIEGPIATEYFQNLLKTDIDEFYSEFDKFIEILENSSENVPYSEFDWDKFDPDWDKRKPDDPNKDYWRNLANGSDEDKAYVGKILERGYIDLTTINCIKGNDGFVFFDQEFYINHLPVKALIYRAIAFIYSKPGLGKICPMDDMLEKYGLKKDRATWVRLCNKPLDKILHQKELHVEYKNNNLDYRTLNENRIRMNYSDSDYERYFMDIFKGVYDKKLYLFGSGKFAERFLDIYGENLDIAGVLDNNAARHNETLRGINIMSPDVLKNETSSYKVIICIKYYDEVLSQLKTLGAVDMSIYNPAKSYEIPRRKEIFSASANESSKKYHIGYVAGVFDLFHVGHVNILKRAKEQCDHLIVGVVSDEQVMKYKKTTPHFSFEDRLEIVRSCKYVDEAYMIPIDRAGTEDAYRMYRFDAQFSGSDYANDPDWLSAQDFLRQHGSELVFFPYTEGVSTTEIKKELEE